MAAIIAIARRTTVLAGSGTPWRRALRCFSSTRSLQSTYGFIGLGQMGYPMAANLRSRISSADALFVHDIKQEATANFKDKHQGVQVATNVREVAEKAEIIITVLPEPAHVKHVFQSMLEPSTLLDHGPANERLFIDCSTIDVKTSAQVCNAVHSSGQGIFVDAPMSGGVVGARSGRLTFMVGASSSNIARVEEILLMMGKRVLHLGPQTSGLKGKLANNYLLALNNIATAEAMHMGVKWGLDAKALADMINTSTGKCWPSEVNNPVPGVIETAPASRNYEGGFGTSLMQKDLRLAIEAAEGSDIEPHLGPVAAEIYKSVEQDPKHKGKDFSVVYQWLSNKA